VSDYAIESVVSAPFDEVCYVVWIKGRTDAVVVDPGFDTRSIISVLERNTVRPAAILNTHGHIDHIAGNRAMKHAYPEAPLIIGRHEADLLTDVDANLSAPFGLPLTSPPADRLVADSEVFTVAGLTFLTREIPGHSPGSVIFFCDQSAPPFVLGGDVIFSGSVGRTDLGGDSDLLFSGIRTKLFTLPESTVIYPGHGPATTIAQEKRSNPFVGLSADS
jgi:glyoxylase-like metal-dependent hydrolase (beta-lactamase superfamily II)